MKIFKLLIFLFIILTASNAFAQAKTRLNPFTRKLQWVYPTLKSLDDTGTTITPDTGNILIADGSKFNSQAMSGDCTITNAGVITCAGVGAPDQNLWETMTGDTGSVIANSTTDAFGIVGESGSSISTRISGDNVIILSTPHLVEGSIDHGNLLGLADDDHSAYENELNNSAGLRDALDDETGTVLAVFNTSPTLVTPTLGVASATSVTVSSIILSDGLLDGVGAVDLDIGSADVLDVTVTTDGGTVVLDGTIVASGSITAGASATPSLDFDDSDDAGTIEGSINVNCPTTNDCDMEIAVNSGADSETVMIKLDTTDAGATTVQLGDPAGGNYINITEAGVMTAVGTASINERFFWVWRPQQAKLPTSDPMGIDAGNAKWIGTFDDTATDESATWETVLYPYQGGILAAKIFYILETTSTTDIAAFDLLIDCHSDGDASYLTFSPGTTNSIDSGAQSLTAGVLDVLTDTSLNHDSCAEFDAIVGQLFRDVSADGVTDDIRLIKVIIYEL